MKGLQLSRTCVGILGGGQLARMSAYQAYKLGFDIAILEKIKNSPAGQLTHNEFVGWVDNKNILKKFAERSDIITLENEFVDYKSLEFIENIGKKVLPSSLTISLIQDKLIQKQTFNKNKIPVSKFLDINDSSNYDGIAEKIGNKFLLKSRKMGYDGYGNYLVRNKKGFNDGISSLTKRHASLLCEEFIRFTKELAIMVVRTRKEIKVYPLVETIQKNHICHIVIAPAQVSKKIKKEAEEIAVEAVKSVNGFGLFGVEMFLTDSNKILVNEMAPRPHNSGHYTIEACTTSQFENHIRSVLNLPIGSTEMIKPFAVMINLLGKREGDGIVKDYRKPLKNENVHLHIYGKDKSRLGRKMGHITIIGDNLKNTLSAAKMAEKETII
jgi:5-(carboxyamino)imidazole ribonucleotide synthase